MGEELGGIEVGKTILRIYYVKKKRILSIEGEKKTPHSLLSDKTVRNLKEDTVVLLGT